MPGSDGGDRTIVVTRMIPAFPTFKPLEATDQQEVESYVAGFAPYSNFNFVSLLTYDVASSVRLSFLNGNLVVQMRDYLTQDRFYTFIGKSQVGKTALALLELARAERVANALRLVPAETIEALNGSSAGALQVTPDPASFDYIHSVTELVALGSSQLARKRRTVRTFIRNHSGCRVALLDPGAEQSLEAARAVVSGWGESKKRSREDVAVEAQAIDRCFTLGVDLRLTIVGAWIGDRLAGFTVNETLGAGYYMGHFGKALPEFRGLSDFLEHETAKVMKEFGCTLMNN